MPRVFRAYYTSFQEFKEPSDVKLDDSKDFDKREPGAYVIKRGQLHYINNAGEIVSIDPFSQDINTMKEPEEVVIDDDWDDKLSCGCCCCILCKETAKPHCECPE